LLVWKYRNVGFEQFLASVDTARMMFLSVRNPMFVLFSSSILTIRSFVHISDFFYWVSNTSISLITTHVGICFTPFCAWMIAAHPLLFPTFVNSSSLPNLFFSLSFLFVDMHYTLLRLVLIALIHGLQVVLHLLCQCYTMLRTDLRLFRTFPFRIP
jgi:hypothetical protein